MGLVVTEGETYAVFAQTKTQLLAIEVPLVDYI